MNQKTARRSRRGFTLVELLAVLGIMMIIIGMVIFVRPSNPDGVNGARRLAESVFMTARFKAQQAQNPDPDANELYNIRSRVLILKDSDNEEQHLRLFRVIVGGTRTQEKAEPSDYVWYGVDSGTMLPKGIYYIEPNETSVKDTRRSRISNRDIAGSNCTMKLNYAPSVKAQPDGSGDKTWYFYEYNEDGTSNMRSAALMVGEGEWDPGARKVLFREENQNRIGGFAIMPNGSLVAYTDSDEMDRSN